MGKYNELLKKFYKETNFLAHSTSYEARTVQEFANWLDATQNDQPHPNLTNSTNGTRCAQCGSNFVRIGTVAMTCAMCGSTRRT